MADEEIAKTNRTTAKRNFTRAEKGLKDAIEQEEDVEFVKGKYNILKERWIQVQEKYELWMRLQADYNNEAEPDDAWLTDLENTYNELERNYISFIRNENKNVAIRNNQLESLKVEESKLENERIYLLTVE